MIVIRSAAEIEIMRRSNRAVARILGQLRDLVKEGATTRDLDRFAEEATRQEGGTPAFKGYKGYPANLCVSINEEVVHGIPGSRKMVPGDIVSMDFGIYLDGYFGDAALTVGVDGVSDTARTLMEVTEQSLYKGIEQARAGNRLYDISHAIESWVTSFGFSAVRDFVGHGIGRNLHEEPQVPNYGPAGQGPRLQPGMVLAIEPMVNAGTWKVKVLDDGWTVVTADRSLSAHFEHTIAILSDGPEILSLP